MTSSTLAREAYEAYGDHTGWKTFNGNPMPEWDELPPPIQEAWQAAAFRIAFLLENEPTQEGCKCQGIMSADKTRHFKGCPIREQHPKGN